MWLFRNSSGSMVAKIDCLGERKTAIHGLTLTLNVALHSRGLPRRFDFAPAIEARSSMLLNLGALDMCDKRSRPVSPTHKVRTSTQLLQVLLIDARTRLPSLSVVHARALPRAQKHVSQPMSARSCATDGIIPAVGTLTHAASRYIHPSIAHREILDPDK